MTGEQSRLLKVGNKVRWQNDQADQGTVTETGWAGLTIKWDSRGEQSILHNDMGSVSSFQTNDKRFEERPSPAARHRLQRLHRLMLLPARVAFKRVRSHCHWTDVHRLILKASGYLPVCKVVPPVSLTKPFPTVHGV
jgi:hypothetical protein